MAAIDWDAFQEATRDFPEELQNDESVMGFISTMFDADLSPDFRHATYDAVHDYIWDRYGLEFDDLFDWDAYRRWYDRTH